MGSKQYKQRKTYANVISSSEESIEAVNEPNIILEKPAAESMPAVPSCSWQTTIQENPPPPKKMRLQNIDFTMDSLERPEATTKVQHSKFSTDVEIENEGNVITLIKKVHTSLKSEIHILEKQMVNQKKEIGLLQNTVNAIVLSENQTSIVFDGENEAGVNAIKLSCTTYEEFQVFEEKLLNDHQYRMQIKGDLIRNMDRKKSIIRNVGHIMRKFLLKEVAEKFTPVKKVKGKEVLKDTQPYQLTNGIF